MFSSAEYWKYFHRGRATFEDLLHSVDAELKFFSHVHQIGLVVSVFHLNYKHSLFSTALTKTENYTVASL